jgi:serine/threonine protein kinase/tetratricopeptide (TPR) repeat protein
MDPAAGSRLGRFEILRPLGAGGMGVVFLARDTRLDRQVAIKLLPQDLAQDDARLARFEREARALARLSHPNILSIYELGEEGGVLFAVTELLEGDTLRGKIASSRITWRRAVEIAAAIADGLAAAHAQGIVHRDLKPENIFVTNDGSTKILDFGLARFDQPVSPEDETLAVEPGDTEPGVILGTVGYMAPEQVRGQMVDHRADVFSLGCVLYEMLSGAQPYAAKTAADTLAAILTAEPVPLSDLRDGLPDGISQVVARCLEKASANRFQAASDLAFALRQLVPAQPFAQVARKSSDDVAPSVAVMPFANLSADPEQEYFCDGTAEEIINALVHVKGLRVVARTSSFAFKARSEDVREIGKALDVAAVLEGSVRKSGERLRITAQLVNVQDGYHLWSERFDRRLEDVFAIQDEIAMAVVHNLEVHLLGHEKGAMGRGHADNLDAHNLFLKGLFYWNKLSPEGFAHSRELFQEAIDKDPGLTSAHVSLAMWYVSLAYWSDLPALEALAAAGPLVDKALELDPRSAEGHTVRGILHGFFEGRWSEAEASLRRAVQLGPNLAIAHLYLGGLLLVQARFEEAAEETRTALRLDPLSPTTGAWAASWLAHSGYLEEGAGELEKLIAMNPDHWLLHWALSHVQARCGKLNDALVESEAAFALAPTPGITITSVICLCARLGHLTRSDELYDQLVLRAKKSFVQPTAFAWVQLARGETAEGIATLEKAVEMNDPMVSFTRLGQGTFFPDLPEVAAFLDRITSRLVVDVQ